MKVSELYADSPIRGNDCYIIGSGPSLNLIDKSFFDGRVCVLLNEANRILPKAGPIGFANNKKQLRYCECPVQVVKGRLRFDPNPELTDNHVSWDSPKFHVFSYRERPWDSVSHFDESRLWAEPDFYWNTKHGSVAIFAIQFAVLCGAKSITLVGCDCCEFSGKEYGGGLRGNASVVHHYDKYAAGILRMKRECSERGIPLLTLSPFVGFGREREQYPVLEALCQK